MELKTLLRLIKDDIIQLDVITNEFDGQLLPLPEEIEVAFVRAKALLRELELLHKMAEKQAKDTGESHGLEEHRTEVHQTPAEPEPLPVPSQKVNDHVITGISYHEPYLTFPAESVPGDLSEPGTQNEEEKYALETKDTLTDNIPAPESAEDHHTSSEYSADEYMTAVTGEQSIPSGEPVEAIAVEVPEIPDHQPGFAADELQEEIKEVKRTLNETFGEQHQMVNDLLTPGKSETAYHIIPIQSIWDGIGINDRFLFIRELFANSSAKFETTVDSIDKLDSIQEAVNYLKMNFKWNKTEASQKFLVLVKRRFTK